ncbi:MAG: DUF5615 family PIN-like protein [Hyphomonadaceae bacterium]|nr:DUF5615 family PIN-like protein [Hyphomonadaceae bacterium]
MILWVDQNLPPALADWLTAQGHSATHVKDLGLDAVDDVVIASKANTTGATILSKDDDFASQGPPPSVIIRLGNVTNTRLIAAFERHWPSIEAALEAGETLVELT